MNLFTATLELARVLADIREGNATAVAATSITDSSSAFANGLYQGGTLWLHDTPPVTKVIELSGGDKITFASGTVPTASVRYSVSRKDYPLDMLRQSINMAVEELRNDVTESTLTSVAEQLSYSISVAGLVKVEVEDAYWPGDYHTHHHWKEVGTALRFKPGYEPGKDGLNIRLTSPTVHTALTADSDVLPTMDVRLMIWRAATHALRWGLGMYGQDPEKHIVERLNEAQSEVTRRGGNKILLRRSAIYGGW